MLLGIGDMASATAGEANRTPTAHTTAKGKAITPRNASSCAESSTDTTATSTSTCRRGDSGHTQPGAEEGAGRKVNIGSNRTKTTRVRVGVGAIRRSSRERHNRKDTDPGLAGMRTSSPEDVATRPTGLGPSAGAAESATTARTRTRAWRVCGPLPRRTWPRDQPASSFGRARP